MDTPIAGFTLALLTLLMSAAAPVAAQGDREITLSAEPAEPGATNYTNAEILPVPDSDTIFAMRETATSELLYQFNLEQVNLYNLLGTLSQTLYEATDTAARIRHGERLTTWDNDVRMRYIDIAVDKLTLQETLDRVSLAAGCNIFVTNRTIVVDRCD